MSTPSATLDAPSSSSSPSATLQQRNSGTNVPRGSSSLHRPLTSAVDPAAAAELQSPYVHLASTPTSTATSAGQSQYCRLASNNNNNNNSSSSVIANSSPLSAYQDRVSGSSIVVPVTTQDPDPFVVTVRNSPSKIGKSSSSSFISKNTSAGLNSCSNKTGPRLALYRSNSSLDLLDRENYYLHHQRASLGGGKLTSAALGHYHGHGHQQQHLERQVSAGVRSKASDGSYTGCFTRRKDFGSHGSIDVLPLSGGVGVGNNNNSGTSSSTVVSSNNSSNSCGSASGVKNERSSSLGSTTSTGGHFLSLVTSAMSRDRRGSFDVHDDGCGSTGSTLKANSGAAKDVTLKETSSPRLSLKFQKLWEHKDKSNSGSNNTAQHSPTGSGGGITDSTSTKGSSAAGGKNSSTSKTDSSIFRKFRAGSAASRNNGNSKSFPEAVKYDTSSGPLTAMNHSGGDNYEDLKPVQLRHGSSGLAMEERYRRRVFAHYDCQSVSANISYAARLRNLLAKRRNTTTGASAASLGHRPVSTPPSASLNNIAGVAPSNSSGGPQLSLTGSSNGNGGGSGNSSGSGGNSENTSLDLVPADDPDMGDGNSNALLLSCPYFRNEIGGEAERLVCLTRFKPNKVNSNSVLRNHYQNLTAAAAAAAGNVDGGGSSSSSLGRANGSDRILNQNPVDGTFHRPQQARGLSLLEWNPGTTHWIHGTCPYGKPSSRPTLLEAVDLGAAYYQKYFHRQDHENWFGSDEVLGPLAISVKRERVEISSGSNDLTSSGNHKDLSTPAKYMYRLIVRSTELNTLRGAILEESIPGIKQPNSSKAGCHAKEVIDFLLPEIQLSCLKLGVQNQGTEDQLLKLDQQILTHRHKVGIMYCKAGQASEEEMYNNEEAGPAFNEFLDLIGQRVRLKGFDKYTGGLDNKDDSTGLYSVYSQYQDCEVILHVSTLLPFTANNRQQLMRKRHIGNDIVTIVFQEPGALPFTPKSIRSQFQHVFIIVRVINPCTENTCYSVSVSRSKEVPLFGPPIPEGAKFLKNKEFVDFLLAKVINAENATYRSEKFTTMATRTRQEYLKDLVSSCSSNTSIDPRPKFSMLPFGSKKKEMGKPKFNADAILRGALSWAVYLDDNSLDSRTEVYVAISVDSLVIIDTVCREPVFAIPCSSILGWNTSMCNSLRIYYHQGECVTLHSKDPGSSGESDDLMEIVHRLEAVTRGCETQEFILRRNDIGQLGFHVQQDGVITEVEPCGFAAKAGLKQGSRLVEICKVAVATLNQEQMIDFLKTSNAVVVMVVPPFPDGSTRRGCDAKHCMYTLDLEAEYDNLNLNGSTDDEPPSLIHHQFKSPAASLLQQAVPGNHRKRYEPRSFSPPRSSNSSGYGTGSSSKSFSSASDPHFPANAHEGETLTSSSSGMSSTDDRWYDLTENLEGTTTAVNNGGSNNNSPPPIPARNSNTATSIIINQQALSATSTPIRAAASIMKNGTTPNSNNNVNGLKGGSGVVRSTLNNNNNNNNNQSFQQQNGTSVLVVQNKHGNNVNGNHNNGIYMTPPAMTGTMVGGTPIEKSFVNKRDFFQRNNPHHGSFHTKLSPSRSHDLLHLKSTYGIHHSQLKPFHQGNYEDYGALTIAANGATRFHDGRLYEHVKPGGTYNSPLIENTVKAKMTYLTDFPLNHSHSSEYLVSYGLTDASPQRDMDTLKNERLAQLKSTYLEKQRERYDRDNESQKSRFSAPADSISGEINRSEDDLSIIVNGKPRSASMTGRIMTTGSPKVVAATPEVKMRQAGSNASTPRQPSANRNSTLKEDLMKLIAPDLIPAHEVEIRPVSGQTVLVNGQQRPSSSGAVPVVNGYVVGGNKSRPVSCGGVESGGGTYGTTSPVRNNSNGVASPSKMNGHNGSNNYMSVPSTPVKRVGQERSSADANTDEGMMKTALPLLPDAEDMDWSTLVDTATKALQCCDIDVGESKNNVHSVNSKNNNNSVGTPPLKLNQSTNNPLHHPLVHQGTSLPLNVVSVTNNVGSAASSEFLGSTTGSLVSSTCSSTSPQSLLPWIDDVKPEDGSTGEGKLPSAPLESVFNLEARVSQLEAELRKEQHSKQVLAAKVANLQQENRFLQEQSHTTQNQFKKFAEWLRNSSSAPPGEKGRKSDGNNGNG